MLHFRFDMDRVLTLWARAYNYWMTKKSEYLLHMLGPQASCIEPIGLYYEGVAKGTHSLAWHRLLPSPPDASLHYTGPLLFLLLFLLSDCQLSIKVLFFEHHSGISYFVQQRFTLVSVLVLENIEGRSLFTRCCHICCQLAYLFSLVIIDNY